MGPRRDKVEPFIPVEHPVGVPIDADAHAVPWWHARQRDFLAAGPPREIDQLLRQQGLAYLLLGACELKGDEDTRRQMYEKLLGFLERNLVPAATTAAQ